MQANVLEYFNQTCDRFPSRIAVSDARGAWDFQTLRKRAQGVACEITKRTTLTNTPIAIYLPKNREAIAAILGILFSGNCYAPLDTKAPPPRIKSILDHLKPTIILTSKELGRVLEENGCTSEQLVIVDELGEGTEDFPQRWRQCIDTDPVYIIHTSGSTGRPKGVVIPHRGVIDYIDWARDLFKIDESCAIGNQAPLIFDNSTLDLYLCFACGASLHLIPEELFLFPVRLLEHLATKSINFIFWVPSIMVTVANKEVLDRVRVFA